MLGQIIIVLSIMEKNFNRQLTSKSKKSNRSGRSGKSAGKSKDKDKKSEKDSLAEAEATSQKSGKSGPGEEEKKSEKPDEEKAPVDYSQEPAYLEKGWFDRTHVQRFLHMYIGEKLRNPKMELVIGHAFEKFISGLPQPLPLNQTRKNMRDEAYKSLREILRTPSKMGSDVFAFLAVHGEEIGIQQNVFNMVWEGFWDLYFKRPIASSEITNKKLEGWINNINLSVPRYPDTVPAGDGEEAKEGEGEGEPAEGAPAGDGKPKTKGVVRIRIPF